MNSSTTVHHEHEPLTHLKIDATHVTDKSLSIFSILLFSLLIAVIISAAILIIKWIIRERRLRELRHRLIPLYTFDPNEEDDWESGFLNDNTIFAQKNQDYNSVTLKEDVGIIGHKL